MAVSNTTQLTGAAVVIDTVVAAAAVVAKASSAVLHALELDNSAVAAVTYFKLYNNAAPVVGTTAPDAIIMIPANATISVAIPGGVTFATALSYVAVTTGGTAGVTATTGAFALKLIYV